MQGPMRQKMWQLMATNVSLSPKLKEIAAFKKCIETLADGQDDLEARIAKLEKQLRDASGRSG